VTWTYEQKTGALRHNGVLIDTGYAGNGRGKNAPELQAVADVGPLPRGVYRIGDPYHSHECGPVTLRLTPDAANEMFGRTLFRIHGDDGSGDASHGCIVLTRLTREKIAASGDRELQVIEGEGK